MDKEARKYKKALVELTEKVARVIVEFDKEASKPQSVERGKRLAKIMTFLELSNDSAMHFDLGWGFKKIANLKQRIVKGK